MNLFTDTVMKSQSYKDLCARLAAKYELHKLDPKEDYPEAYWEEFNIEYSKLLG